MPLEYRFRQMAEWPRDVKLEYLTTPFKNAKRKPMPLSDTPDMLGSELAHLSAKGVILQLDFENPAREIRQDGMLRADARRPRHPGVILTFDSKFGPLSYPAGRFSDWESNLRAVAYHLHHTRLASLYGVGSRGEAYKGFPALPPPVADAVESAAAAPPKSHHQVPAGPRLSAGASPVDRAEATARHEAAALLLGWAEGEGLSYERLMRGDAEHIEAVYRSAVRRAHPDGGGHAAAFQGVQRARNILRQSEAVR